MLCENVGPKLILSILRFKKKKKLYIYSGKYVLVFNYDPENELKNLSFDCIKNH